MWFCYDDNLGVLVFEAIHINEGDFDFEIASLQLRVRVRAQKTDSLRLGIVVDDIRQKEVRNDHYFY